MCYMYRDFAMKRENIFSRMGDRNLKISKGTFTGSDISFELNEYHYQVSRVIQELWSVQQDDGRTVRL